MLQLRPKPPEEITFTSKTNISEAVDSEKRVLRQVLENLLSTSHTAQTVLDYIVTNKNNVITLKPIVNKEAIEIILGVLRTINTNQNYKIDFSSESLSQYERIIDAFASALPTEVMQQITAVVEARAAYFKSYNLYHPTFSNFNSVKDSSYFSNSNQARRHSIPIINSVARTALWLQDAYPDLRQEELFTLAKLTSSLYSPVDLDVKESSYEYVAPYALLLANMLKINPYAMYRPYMQNTTSRSPYNIVSGKRGAYPCLESQVETSLALQSYIEKRKQYFVNTAEAETIVTPYKPFCFNQYFLPEIKNVYSAFNTQGVPHVTYLLDKKYSAVLPPSINVIQVPDEVSGSYHIPYYICVDELLNVKLLFPFMTSTFDKLKIIYNLKKRNPLAPYNKDSDVLTNSMSTNYTDVIRTLFGINYEIRCIVDDGCARIEAEGISSLGLEDITYYFTGATPSETKDENLFHAFLLRVTNVKQTTKFLSNYQPK